MKQIHSIEQMSGYYYSRFYISKYINITVMQDDHTALSALAISYHNSETKIKI